MQYKFLNFYLDKKDLLTQNNEMIDPILIENREEFYHNARKVGLNLQVHYIPVHTQPYYQQFGYKWGDYPNAEYYYEHCISLPLYFDLKDKDLMEIIRRIKGLI